MGMTSAIKKKDIFGIVYLANNKTNSKKYVGITTRSLRDRITGHVSSANRGDGNTNSIQAAIREKNIEAFDFTVLHEAQDMEQFLEKEMFFIRELNTMAPNGYNQNVGGAEPGGLLAGKSIKIDGEFFPSHRAASNYFGLVETQLGARLAKGWSPEQAAGLVAHPDGRSHIKIHFKGQDYDSFHDICIAYGVNERTALSRYKQYKWPLEKVFSTDNYVEISTNKHIVDGHIFDGDSDLARHYKKYQSTVSKRLRQAWTAKQAVDIDPPPPRKKRRGTGEHVVDGKTFYTDSALARYYKKHQSTVSKRLRQGWTAKQAVGIDPPPPGKEDR